MIGSVQNVSALSFTRELDGTQASGSSIVQHPGVQPPVVDRSFETTLANIGGDMITNLRSAEGASYAGIAGEADTRQVVDAVMTAEQTLQTAIAIRDKIVSAYLEISRMHI
jgi:flagellar hook-basal body complex protein FliE